MNAVIPPQTIERTEFTGRRGTVFIGFFDCYWSITTIVDEGLVGRGLRRHSSNSIAPKMMAAEPATENTMAINREVDDASLISLVLA